MLGYIKTFDSISSRFFIVLLFVLLAASAVWNQRQRELTLEASVCLTLVLIDEFPRNEKTAAFFV
jgi:hypothetical protein